MPRPVGVSVGDVLGHGPEAAGRVIYVVTGDETEAQPQGLAEWNLRMMSEGPALPSRRMPRTITHLVGRQLPFRDLLAQPGNLITMMATRKTGWLSGPVPDENGRSAVERSLNRSPSVVPVRGIGA